MTGKISNNQIKSAKSLHQKKYRDKLGLYIVEGTKLVGEALVAGAKVEIIAYVGEATDFPYPLPVEALRVAPADMGRMSALKHASPILAVCRKPEPRTRVRYEGHILALDGVSDPGNLGTILRICDWFGFSQLLCGTDSVELYNPKVVQASMGSVFRVDTVYGSLEAAIDARPEGFAVCAADMEGESLYESALPKEAIWVLGSESHGLASALRDRVESVFAIPRHGGAESLNVAVAAAILAYEVRRPQTS